MQDGLLYLVIRRSIRSYGSQWLPRSPKRTISCILLARKSSKIKHQWVVSAKYAWSSHHCNSRIASYFSLPVPFPCFLSPTIFPIQARPSCPGRIGPPTPITNQENISKLERWLNGLHTVVALPETLGPIPSTYMTAHNICSSRSRSPAPSSSLHELMSS